MPQRRLPAGSVGGGATVMSLEDAFVGMASLQRLIDSGAAWRLDGAIERAALRAIRDGTCVLGPQSFRDRWGIRVPSRDEVGPDRPGSVAYANARRAVRGLPPIDVAVTAPAGSAVNPPSRPRSPRSPTPSPAGAQARHP